MGKGTMNCKDYITKRGYYLDKDYDEKVGGEFYNFDGSFTVEGECYIITNENVLRRYITDAQKELKGKPIWYYHIDGDRKILREEKVYP